ncbi:unnamed protein product [Rhodiola kirilowii]
MRTAYDIDRGLGWRIVAAIFSPIAAVVSMYWDLVIDWGTSPEAIQESLVEGQTPNSTEQRLLRSDCSEHLAQVCLASNCPQLQIQVLYIEKP